MIQLFQCKRLKHATEAGQWQNSSAVVLVVNVVSTSRSLRKRMDVKYAYDGRWSYFADKHRDGKLWSNAYTKVFNL
jgi:hypothetical protein